MNSTPIIEQPVSTSAPPFPEILQVDREIEKQIMLPNYDFVDELKNVCIKIPLLHFIKEIQILAKTIGLPGSTYFCMEIFPIIMSVIFPTR